MARLDDMHETLAQHLRGMEYPSPGDAALVSGPPLKDRRVAIVTSAALIRPGDTPFGFGGNEYRVLPTEDADQLVISHLSTNFDRTGFQQDLNIVFPIDRLHEMAADGEIASVADYHYSFMGAADPAVMEDAADQVAGMLKQDQVDAVLLTPV